MQRVYLRFFFALTALMQGNMAWAAESTEKGMLDQVLGTFNGFWFSILFWNNHPLQLPFILVVMVAGGLFFTIRYGFVNVKLFKHAIDVVRGLYDKKDDKGEITHFQALTSALSATVGLGNIAGVAVAIAVGGPGAVLWLWVIAFFGMSMKFSSCTFAQLYRVVHKDDGSVLGGPMVYLKEGFKEFHPSLAGLGKILAVIFAFFTISASFGGGNLFQGNQMYELLSNELVTHGIVEKATLSGGVNVVSIIIGLILAFAVGIVMIGGITRIGDVTSRMVPAMVAFYVICCLFIIFGNISDVPGVIASIFKQAFVPEAAFGGFIGVLTQGVQRASFSNEAGLGSAAIAHAAAKTDRPVREGVVAMLGPFIDTHLVCTMTSLAILITGAHLDPELAGKGAAITSKAFSSLGFYMPLFLTIATVIFAYSTIISWSYYGEKAVEYLFGRGAIKFYRGFYVFVVALGPLLKLTSVIDFADAMLLSMAFPNIIGMMFLSGQVKKHLDKYLNDYKEHKLSKTHEHSHFYS